MMKISVKTHLEGHSLLHENRKYRRGEGVTTFVDESLFC